MKIGVYGGTFNPPHLGHLTSGRLAMEQLGLDRLIFVPAGTPPHKQLPAGSPSARQRLAMTAIAADGLLLGERAAADAIEVEREGASYTSDTLAALRERYPEDELWLLVGSDMLRSLRRWHEPERICALAGVAAFARSGADDPDVMEAQAEALRLEFGATVKVLYLTETIPVSSTQIRAKLAQGERDEALPEPVWGYILLHGLYGTHADLKHLDDGDLRACALSMVQAKRHAHIRGVETEAEKLAVRWGADPVAARRAGILHDCTKYWTLEQHLACCEKYGMELDQWERKAVKLLHAKTGACLAKAVFGESDAVCDAICYHTTGRADMTLLEKILYIADYMEPNRDFDGVETMRRLAYEDLDAAVLLGCEMSIADMEERGYLIHHNTMQARDWLKGKCP